jgi:hypothetical protein
MTNELYNAVMKIIEETMSKHDLKGPKVESAMIEAVFQAVGYTRSYEAKSRMEQTRYMELERNL